MPIPVHFRYLFSPDEAFLVLHPLSPSSAIHEAASMPAYAIERFGPTIAVRKENRSLLFESLRQRDLSICRKCHRAEFCPVLTWDHAWLTKTGLSLVPAFVVPEKTPQWKELFDDFLARFTAKRTIVSVSESILGLRPPYTRADVLKAYKRAVLAHHPDHGGSEAAFKRAVDAKNELIGVLG